MTSSCARCLSPMLESTAGLDFRDGYSELAVRARDVAELAPESIEDSAEVQSRERSNARVDTRDELHSEAAFGAAGKSLWRVSRPAFRYWRESFSA